MNSAARMQCECQCQFKTGVCLTRRCPRPAEQKLSLATGHHAVCVFDRCARGRSWKISRRRQLQCQRQRPQRCPPRQRPSATRPRRTTHTHAAGRASLLPGCCLGGASSLSSLEYSGPPASGVRRRQPRTRLRSNLLQGTKLCVGFDGLKFRMHNQIKGHTQGIEAIFEQDFLWVSETPISACRVRRHVISCWGHT